MGRRTWESLKAPLPQRENIVVTRTAGYEAPGAAVAASLDAALALCFGEPVAFVIGGTRLFEEAMPIAAGMVITEIKRDYEAIPGFPNGIGANGANPSAKRTPRTTARPSTSCSTNELPRFRIPALLRQREAVEPARVGGGVGAGVLDAR